MIYYRKKSGTLESQEPGTAWSCLIYYRKKNQLLWKVRNLSRGPRILLRVQKLSKNPIGIRNRQQYSGNSRQFKVPDFPEYLTFFFNISNNLFLKLICNLGEFWRSEFFYIFLQLKLNLYVFQYIISKSQRLRKVRNLGVPGLRLCCELPTIIKKLA